MRCDLTDLTRRLSCAWVYPAAQLPSLENRAARFDPSMFTPHRSLHRNCPPPGTRVHTEYVVRDMRCLRTYSEARVEGTPYIIAFKS